jgi:hypothetical protein
MLGQRLNNPPYSLTQHERLRCSVKKGNYLLFDLASEAQVLGDKGDYLLHNTSACDAGSKSK